MKKINNKIKFVLICLAFVLCLFGCDNGNTEEEKAQIVLDEEISELELKEEYCIMYSVKNGTEANVSFSSSDDAIVKTDDEGYIIGKKAGTATITITVALTSGETITKDLTITVVDNSEYKITFQLAGGECDVEYGTAKAGSNYTLPTPTKENSVFLGWTMNGVEGYITEVTNVKQNCVVRANWQNYYKINYELDGGTYSDDKLYEEGTTVTLGTPTKEGNKFLGWSYTATGTSYFYEIKPITSTRTVYAHWQAIQVDLDFDLDGGYYNGASYVTYGGSINLGVAQKQGYEFVGWTLNKNDATYVTKLDNVTETKTLYAHYQVDNDYKDFIVTNLDSEGIVYNTTLKLEISYFPTSLSGYTKTFTSSDESIFTVDSTGTISALKVGVAKLNIILKGSENMSQELEIKVYIPGTFEVSYETNSYVAVGEKIKLNASYVNKNGITESVTLRSLNSDLVSVNNNEVTGLKEGLAQVEAKSKNGDTFNIYVTVISKETSEGINFVLNSHESNVFTRYNLGIGAGTPVYYMDIIGSVSDYQYTEELVIDRTYEAVQAAVDYNHGGEMSSVEFITVHYTGNMAAGATGAANAGYFSSGGGDSIGTSGKGTSIHYVTGNDGIFSSLADNLVGRHAGDGTDVTFEWYKTGVMVKDGDPEYPVWGISKNSKFTINGQETTIDVPTGNASKSPNTVKVTGDTFIYNGKELPCINKMGLPFKIVDGEYYMGTTWWCYTQAEGGRICSKGGNNNSIGIESAVNQGSDLWYTWHKTAKLVAKLMVDNNLDITRVVGHQFFTAKNCPQPMLENDLEIWWKFKELVTAEYERITTLKDYSFTYETINNGNTERVVQDTDTKTILYKVTITKGGKTETITLASVINGSNIRNLK